MKRIIILGLLVCLWGGSAFAYDWTKDSRCAGAWIPTLGSGATIIDSSSNSNTANFASSGHPAWSVMTGSGAPRFNHYELVFVAASSDYINVGTMGNFGTNLDTTYFMFSTWVKSSNTTDVIGVCGVFNTGTVTAIRILLNRKSDLTVSKGCIIVFRRDQDANNIQSGINTDTGITDGNWHHLFVGVSNTTTVIYVDGVSKTITTTTNTTPDNMANFGFGMGVGAVNSRDVWESFFDGSMGETAIFSGTILTPTEINDIKNNGLKQALTTKKRAGFSMNKMFGMRGKFGL